MTYIFIKIRVNKMILILKTMEKLPKSFHLRFKTGPALQVYLETQSRCWTLIHCFFHHSSSTFNGVNTSAARADAVRLFQHWRLPGLAFSRKGVVYPLLIVRMTLFQSLCEAYLMYNENSVFFGPLSRLFRTMSEPSWNILTLFRSLLNHFEGCQ